MKRKTPTRDDWRLNQDACFVPGCKCSHRNGDVMECHEIIGGSDRPKALLLPATFLWLCRKHHSELGSRPNQESLVRQLAIKLWSDPEHANVETVVRLWRPNCTREFLAEIISAVQDEYRKIAREWT